MKFCYVNPEGGAVTVTTTANNGARSSWKCAHAHKEETGNWKAIEPFDLSTGDEGTVSHALLGKSSDFVDTALLWRVTACGEIQGVIKAKFNLTITQDGEEKYSIDSERKIPMCKDNSAIQFKDMVIFKYHSNEDEKSDIWDVL